MLPVNAKFLLHQQYLLATLFHQPACVAARSKLISVKIKSGTAAAALGSYLAQLLRGKYGAILSMSRYLPMLRFGPAQPDRSQRTPLWQSPQNAHATPIT